MVVFLPSCLLISMLMFVPTSFDCFCDGECKDSQQANDIGIEATVTPIKMLPDGRVELGPYIDI